jgi:hypothetical protein
MVRGREGVLPLDAESELKISKEWGSQLGKEA